MYCCSEQAPCLGIVHVGLKDSKESPPSSCLERDLQVDVYHHLLQDGNSVQKGSQCITIWVIFKLNVDLFMTFGQAPQVVQVFQVAPVVLQGLSFLPVQEVHVPLGVQLVPVFLPVL